jgi:hypothetical protein
VSTHRFETVPLAPEDAKSGFDCGKAPLNEYLARYAGQNQRAGVSRTWVLRRQSTQSALPPVLGYYTLTLAAITSEDLPSVSARKKMPRYPLPVALIGRLARDGRAPGLRLGERLLVDAHARALAVSDQAGCIGVVVDAKDAEAERFYLRYGYERLTSAGGTEKWPVRLYIAMETVRDGLGLAG